MKDYKSRYENDKNNEERQILEKAEEYAELLGIKKESDGWNDAVDAFRHVWGSAYTALKYGDAISHFSTWNHENGEKGQGKDERNMDEWNNAVGREIAKELKDKQKSYNWQTIEDIIAVKVKDKLNKGEIITKPSDKRVYGNNIKFNLRAIKNDYDEKLSSFTARLAQSKPSDDSQGEPKPTGHNLKEVLAQQKEKLKENTKRLFEGSGLEKRFRGEIPKDYVNEESGDNKIFTLEQVNAMDESDKKKYEKAIAYQKRVVGLPTERNLACAQSHM